MAAIDGALNQFCERRGLPPLLVLMAWPCVVHFMYALVWVAPGVWFPSSKPMARVWHFRNLAYSKQVYFYGLLPWYLGLLDPVRLAEAYSWRIFGQMLAQSQPILAIGLAMLAFGCFLEVASFNAIGEAAILCAPLRHRGTGEARGRRPRRSWRKPGHAIPFVRRSNLAACLGRQASRGAHPLPGPLQP
jgi:hypothetical protein